MRGQTLSGSLLGHFSWRGPSWKCSCGAMLSCMRLATCVYGQVSAPLQWKKVDLHPFQHACDGLRVACRFSSHQWLTSAAQACSLSCLQSLCPSLAQGGCMRMHSTCLCTVHASIAGYAVIIRPGPNDSCFQDGFVCTPPIACWCGVPAQHPEKYSICYGL